MTNLIDDAKLDRHRRYDTNLRLYLEIPPVLTEKMIDQAKHFKIKYRPTTQ